MRTVRRLDIVKGSETTICQLSAEVSLHVFHDQSGMTLFISGPTEDITIDGVTSFKLFPPESVGAEDEGRP